MEIIVEAENEALNEVILQKIATTCDVAMRTVKRWVENQLQPNLVATTKILKVLQEYNPDLAFEDLIKESSIQKKVKAKFNLTK
jgi:archaellum biogenesis ATPase FlaH